MSKLTRHDWEILRNEYGVAFMGLKKDLFDLLLDKVYGKQGSRRLVNPGRLDSTDALMFYLARTEPPIPPGPQPRKAERK